MASSDPSELFTMLESNNAEKVAEVKSLIHENLGTTREPWLLNGLVDYYLSTDSKRCLDILIGIREPHDKHLFDKINDCLKGNSRKQALTLLGHIVRKQPSWLHKIANHSVFSTLLKILKTENDVLIIMAALLELVMLLPMIPSLVAPYLTEVFEIFSRLAAWKVKKPGNVPDIYILHLQVGVYALFHRLYGMYPCNFLSYLRSFYGKGEQLHVFTETVRPMLERVRMHPLLVTASKEMEVSNARWKKMETHDIVVECAKVSLDLIEGSREEISHSSYPYPCLPEQQGSREARVSFQQKGDSIVTKASEALSQSLEQHSILGRLLQESTDVSPSTVCGLSTPLPLQTSPDATLLNIPQSASILTLLESPLLEPDSASSSRSQISRSGPPTPSPGSFHLPCSPLRNEGSPFKFPPTEHIEKTKEAELKAPSKSRVHAKALSFTLENISVEFTTASVPSTTESTKLEDSDTKQSIEEEKSEDQEVSDIVEKNVILSSEAKESGQESPFHCTTTNLTAGQQSGEGGFQRSDSLLHDEPEGGGGFSSMEYEESAQVSMVHVMDYMRRFRYYSQCGPAPDLSAISTKPSLTRSHSCPEIKKDKKTQEEENRKKSEAANSVVLTVNPPENLPKAKTSEKKETDEEKKVSEQSDTWQNQQPKASSLAISRPTLPYEDLFPLTLPVALIPKCPQCLHCQESLSQGQKTSFPFYHLSPPEILDRHIQFGSNILAKELKSLPITTSKVTNWAHFGGPPPADEINILRGQVLLLHNQLLYERHKREIHAERNRRLLGKAKNARALEEQNMAMKDQMQLQERDIARLSTAHNTLLKQNYQLRDEKEKELQERLSQIRNLRQENEQLKFANKELQTLLVEHKTENDSLQKEDKQMKKRLYEISLDLEGAQEQLSHNDTLREEVDRLNKELILMGELQNKYREKFSNIPVSRQSESEANEATETYVREVAAIKESLNAKNCQIDLLRSRIAELENIISKKDSTISEQNKILKTVQEKYDEEIQAKEDLQQEITILAISIRSSCLALQAKIPIPQAAIGGKACVMAQGESPSTGSLDTSGIGRSRITEGIEDDDELPSETEVVLADSETSKESVS